METIRTRLTVVIAASTIAGWLAGIICHGTPLSLIAPEIAVCCISVGGITGGFLNGRTFCERCWYTVPFLALSVFLMLLTSSYLTLRGCAFLPEFIIPLAVALVPFTIVYGSSARIWNYPEAGSPGVEENKPIE